MNLTPRQLDVVVAIRNYRHLHGYSPTMQELADQLGTSKVTIFEQVVALIDGAEATLKRFYKEPGGRVRLQPANHTMEPRIVEADRCKVQGVVIGVLRSYA